MSENFDSDIERNFCESTPQPKELTQPEMARILQHCLRHKWTNADDTIALMETIHILRTKEAE